MITKTNNYTPLSSEEIEVISSVPKMTDKTEKILKILASFLDKIESFHAIVTVPKTLRSLQKTTKLLKEKIESRNCALLATAIVTAAVFIMIFLTPLSFIFLVPVLALSLYIVFANQMETSRLEKIVNEQQKIVQESGRSPERCVNQHVPELLALVNTEEQPFGSETYQLVQKELLNSLNRLKAISFYTYNNHIF